MKASPSELGSPRAIPYAHGISGSRFSKDLGRRHEITAGSWGPSSPALPRTKSQKGGILADAGAVSVRAALSHSLPVPGSQTPWPGVMGGRLEGKMNPEKREEHVYSASSHFTRLSCFLHQFTVCKGLPEISGCWSQTPAEERLGRCRCLFQTSACVTVRQENRKAALESGSEMSARDQGPSRAHRFPCLGHAT